MMINMENDIANRIRDCVAESGRTQASIAVAIGLSPSQLSKSLNGTRDFSAVELAELASVLNVSLYWLVMGEIDPMNVTLAARHRYASGKRRYSADGLGEDRHILDDIALIYRQAYC